MLSRDFSTEVNLLAFTNFNEQLSSTVSKLTSNILKVTLLSEARFDLRIVQEFAAFNYFLNSKLVTDFQSELEVKFQEIKLL